MIYDNRRPSFSNSNETQDLFQNFKMWNKYIFYGHDREIVSMSI